MILGIGSDIVNVERIEKTLQRHSQRFPKRCFTAYEISKAEAVRKKGQTAQSYAKSFAAKEACAKALGTGFRDGIYLKDIGVENDDNGRPFIKLSGGAKKQFDSMVTDNKTGFIHLSISDEPPYAQAFVVIEAV